MLFLLAQRPTPTNGALLAAFRRRGIEAALLPVGDTQAREGDTVLVRLPARAGADGIEPGLAQADALADEGVLLLNRAGGLAAAHDKLAPAIRLARAGLPHPRTLHVDWPMPLPELDYPAAVKPRFGGRGGAGHLSQG